MTGCGRSSTTELGYRRRGFKSSCADRLIHSCWYEISNPPWVKFQSAGWVNFPSAPTNLLWSIERWPRGGSSSRPIRCRCRPHSSRSPGSTDQRQPHLVSQLGSLHRDEGGSVSILRERLGILFRVTVQTVRQRSLTARAHKIRRIRTRPARPMAAVGRNRNHGHNARGI